jgi:hypothetical protein
MNMDGAAAIGVGRGMERKVSNNQIQDLVKKMFNPNNASKFGSSEFGDVSKWDAKSQIDRSY